MNLIFKEKETQLIIVAAKKFILQLPDPKALTNNKS
jgi:hypothetical protein